MPQIVTEQLLQARHCVSRRMSELHPCSQGLSVWQEVRPQSHMLDGLFKGFDITKSYESPEK